MKTSTDELSDSDFLDVSAAFTRRVKKRSKKSQVGRCIVVLYSGKKGTIEKTFL